MPISAASVEGNDNLGNSWTITTSGTTFFSAYYGYCQVGSANNPASSITFTTTLPNEVNVTAMEAKFGGFSGTAGDVTLMVDDTSIGTGNLNGQSDVTVTSTSGTTGTVLTVTLTSISKGVKCYYISYTYTYEDDAATTTTIDASGITNTDVYNSPAAGSLSATVKDNNNVVISGATVTWSSSNTDVATIASDGTITLVAAGTTTITASYAGDDTYASSSDTYELTVTSSAPYVQPTSIEINLNNTIIPGLNAGSRITEETTTNIDNVSLTFNKTQSGSNYPQFDADLVRMYANTYVRLDAPSGYNIVKVEFTDTYSWNDVSTDVQTLDKSTRTWNGEATSITFSFGAQCRPSKMVVTLETATAKVLSSIALSGTYPTTFTVGDTFSHEGMVVTATYEGGETEDVTSSAVFSSPDMTTTGEKTVTVSYTRGEVTKTAEYTITVNPVPVMTIAEVRAQGTGNVKTQGVVTSCVGVTAYIQDATAAICVYGEELTVGDDIIVEGTLTNFHSLLEITTPTYNVVSSGNTVTPVVKTIADINADTEKTMQGLLVKIENATVTEISGENTTISQGENTIVVRGISGVEYDVDDILTLTGNIGCYNNAQIANPTNVQVQETPRVEYYLAGSFATTQEWKDDMKKLTQNQDGTYSITMNDFSAGTAFKIVRKNRDNSLTWFGGQSDNNTYEIHNLWWKDIQMVQDNKNFTIPTSGNYTFTVNVTAMKLTVTGWTYTLKGSFDEWAAGETFTSQGNGVYTLTKELTAVTTFKIVDERNNYYSNGAFSKDNCTDLAIYTDNADMTIAEASEYVFTLTTDNNSIKLTVTGWPVVVEGDKFVKVTSTADLTNGKYLIVYEDANVAFDGSLATLDATSNTIEVDIVNDCIIVDEDNINSVFTINVTDGSIKSASGKFIGHTGNSNGLAESSDTQYTNTFSIDEDKNAVIVSGNATLQFNANSGQTRFRYFTSANQQAIQLYKLVLPEVTFSENDTEATTITANDNKLVNATLERTLSNTYWSTFSVPFNVTAEQIAEALGTVELREFDGSEGTVIKFKAATAITAGQAYLVKPAETVTDPEFNAVTVVNTTGIEDSDNNGYGFVGAVIKKTLKTDQTELFLGTDAKFYYPESEAKATMKGLRGYFVVPAGTVPSKLSVDVEGSGIATSINSMNIEGMGDGNIYNLNGQRVNAPQKGLYIVNGKKVIIK